MIRKSNIFNNKMNDLLKNKGFLAFLGLVGLVIVCVIINSLTKTTTEDGEEIGALSALWRRLTKKDVVKKDDTDVVDDNVDDEVDDEVDDVVNEVSTSSFITTAHTPRSEKDGVGPCGPITSSVQFEGNSFPSETNREFKITSNNVPNHEMDDEEGEQTKNVYAACPTAVTRTYNFGSKVGMEECNDGEYYDDECKVISGAGNRTDQPHRAQFKGIGVLGRPATAGHWSLTNLPQEVVDYDPTPAECWDVEPHECKIAGDDTESVYRFNIYGANQWNGEKVKHKSDKNMNVGVDKYRAHVQPQKDANDNIVGGLYHYHPPPLWDNGTYADKVIGYLYDGIPIMGKGSKVTINGDNSVEATSSYTINDSWDNESPYNCPSSTEIPQSPKEAGEQALFHSCYKFDKDFGNLDRYNGGISTALGHYAYFSTGEQYPYLPVFVKGKYDN